METAAKGGVDDENEGKFGYDIGVAETLPLMAEDGGIATDLKDDGSEGLWLWNAVDGGLSMGLLRIIDTDPSGSTWLPTSDGWGGGCGTLSLDDAPLGRGCSWRG